MEAQHDERLQMLKAFDDTKAGVKGLHDSGLLQLPNIFIRPSEELPEEAKQVKGLVQVPVIDLSNITEPGRRKQIVEQVRGASEEWGFFQVVNHGIPLSVLHGMIDGVRNFHERDAEEKKKYYTRDATKTVRYNSSYDLFTSRTASWRDTLSISINSGTQFMDPQELPAVCRVSCMEFSKHVEILANTLLGLLSEALGLKSEVLESMECSLGHRLQGHYYPACPQPELAIGLNRHSDPGFLTILLQNQLVSGLQLVTNGRFRSIEHRAIPNREGPRISVACFFSGPLNNKAKVYAPIQGLITEENPAVYKEIVLREYLMKFLTTGLDNYRALDYYKV